MSTKKRNARDPETSEEESEESEDSDSYERPTFETKYIVDHLLVMLARFILDIPKYEKTKWKVIAEIMTQGVDMPEEVKNTMVTAENVEEYYDELVDEKNVAVKRFEKEFRGPQK